MDFNKLRTATKKPKAIDPLEIFRRLPKAPGINDLYTSQAEVLQSWFAKRSDRDVVLKLHTGGGKTLVGLLLAQSSLNELGDPVLYLTVNNQLVNQTVAKAISYGIDAVPYTAGVPLDEDFKNGTKVMVATYAALFHGKSKFGVRGGANAPVSVSAVVLDDAHAAFSVLRDQFTLAVEQKTAKELYAALTNTFRAAFREIGKVGTFDDIVNGDDYGVIEVPYWAWREKLDAVQELLKARSADYALVWPLLRDNLHLCHALITRSTFSITPALPLVNAIPTFFDAPRRVYMSATIADDSEIIRTFGAGLEAVSSALTSRSLAGVSERMIIIPELMPSRFDVVASAKKLLQATASKKKGAVVLVPSTKAAANWTDIATLPANTQAVEVAVEELQTGQGFGPVVFASRYDGIDLPGNACRLLVIDGLPVGTSDYELFRAAALHGATAITRMLAQRIEQGMGRGARGAGDHCVVLMLGRNLSAWVAKASNFRYLTSATRAQLEMGQTISKSIANTKELGAAILKSYNREKDWTEFHAETLADLVDETAVDKASFKLAAAERKAVDLWQDGHHESAIARIQKALADQAPDDQTVGWFEQLSARIADSWGHSERAQELQRSAYSNNRNLQRPKVLPPYRPIPEPNDQAKAIVARVEEYKPRRGFMQAFEEAVSALDKNASANQFEQALADLGRMIGLSAERHDENGEGPDVLWLFPSKIGWVIEAKSRKKAAAALKKEEHGQLLVAKEWFSKNYPGFGVVAVSMHPEAKATKAAGAYASHALTYEKLAMLVSDARTLLTAACDSQLPKEELARECARLLGKSPVAADKLAKTYLQPFAEL
ncbi:MAG: DEAD/DEAH box helicase [Acidobacteriota bacterium]|nr:DEAD/DEAH box helicase [Acidobacteriota bacterium]